MSSSEVQPSAATAENEPPRRTWGSWFRSFVIQMLIFYAISSFFRQSKPVTEGPGAKATPGKNMFARGQQMELYVYLSEEEFFTDFHDENALIWYLDNLSFGTWTDGPNKDGTRAVNLELNVPQTVQHNSSWFLHVYLTKEGISPDPHDDNYLNDSVIYQQKLLTSYRKRRINYKVNLLSSEANNQVAKGNETEIISYYHPNLTISIVDDQSPWQQGSVPAPLDEFIIFDNLSGNYWPVMYLNDYWNLARDYQPINETTSQVPLHLTYQPLSIFKFQLYVAIAHQKSSWWQQSLQQQDDDDEDQDTLKETLLDTNPYLLAVTVAVTLLHTVFEFLAFKNDVQFWRSRQSLEGLSARSVLFGLFQSFVVFLYILDNDTNMVVIFSVFIGLLIDGWKITKVVIFTIDRDSPLMGFLPRVNVSFKQSYAESPTRHYDMLAFKYLSWVLFPLFLSYGVYSLMYHEHKGWYSFVLSMTYGFLLTFGFIMMTPQLFINYKMKSVAHLPWRMLTYKALNTFIDDMFAFVIKMPFLYRIGCFRDDIVFFIYLYQRWIYPMDPHRVNEFGTSAVDSELVDQQPSVDQDANLSESSSIEELTPVEDETISQSDIRQRVHSRED